MKIAIVLAFVVVTVSPAQASHCLPEANQAAAIATGVTAGEKATLTAIAAQAVP